MSDSKAVEQWENKVAEAVKLRDQMVQRLASRSFLVAPVEVKTHGVGTLKQVFNSLEVRDTWNGKHHQLVKQYFADTLNFFSETSRLVKKFPAIQEWRAAEVASEIYIQSEYTILNLMLCQPNRRAAPHRGRDRSHIAAGSPPAHSIT